MPPAPNTRPAQENPRRPWPPFRPRQPRADTPHFPGPRWNPRTAKFLAIRSKQPPLTLRAACARYRLGRNTATWHYKLLRQLEHAQKHLTALCQSISLLHTRILLPADFPASVIHDVERTSSLCRTFSAPAPSHSIYGDYSFTSTRLHASLEPPLPHCSPPSTAMDFFDG
ncbi:hypothetical protein R3P38DRAFT_3094406 [Favolaschia claudopus]|uniref:Uncharacterized protein n=1 Tax=Favolaschia claudopus TaxID=2862362 RepID=A0AAV9ZQN1_9AGAR